MNNRIYPSIATLPVEDLANYLSIVHGFRSKNELAPDVNRVDGVNSNKIAIAAVDEAGNLVQDRYTVNNALKLNGLDASKYLTVDNSQSLLVDSHNVSVIAANEIKNLRDELYQMKSELVKNGLIRDNYSYHGYQDPFRLGNIKYVDEVVTRGAQIETRATISDITVVDSTNLFAGEYIIVEDAGRNYMTKIVKKEGNRLFISPSIDGPFDTVANIKRSLGMYWNGSFLFGEEYGQLISDKEKYIILNDEFGGADFALPRLTTKNNGYAVGFHVPRSVAGALTKLTVSVRGQGRPGALKCYIIDADDEDGTNVFNMSLTELTDAGKVLGESDVIPSDVVTGAFVDRDFVFSNPVMVESKVKTKYIAFIKCLDGTDSENYWELRGLRKYGDGDLHTNIDLYPVFNDSIDEKSKFVEDIYFAITTNEVIANNVGYLQSGLYSAKIELPENETATRLRVELKVNREGRFKVIDAPHSVIIKQGDSINLVNEDKRSYTGSIFTSDSTIVVGNQISRVGNSRLSNTTFSLAQDTYAPANADVYRIGYNVSVTARNKSIDYNDVTDPVKYANELVLPLELKAVIPGKEAGKEDGSSDRLIFETDFTLREDSHYKLREFNDFLVQVAWTSTGVTPAEMYSNPELSGAIYDITISTDRAYNKLENPAF